MTKKISTHTESDEFDSEFKTLHSSFYHIDHETDEINKIDLETNNRDLEDYTKKLLAEIQKQKSNKVFKFISSNTEVHSAIKLMLDDKFSEAIEITTKRLLKVEQETQKKISHLKHDVLKGSLFQSVIQIDDNQKMIIIAKADHNDFLDMKDLSIHKGLPWKKKIFKSFFLVANDSDENYGIKVSDSNATISKYWWHDFFELTEVRTDTFNTESFLDFFERKILKPIKTDSPADHERIRNAALGFFYSNEGFNIESFSDSIFNNYSPKNQELNIQKLKSKTDKLPETYDIDSQFTIDKKSIKKRSVNKYRLDEGLELILSGGFDSKVIKAFKDPQGEKWISLPTTDGYDTFI